VVKVRSLGTPCPGYSGGDLFTEAWVGLASRCTRVGQCDRHNIRDRADIKKYALGVLGLASLLLTQTRYAHPRYWF
jgi:hypothetical protein